MFSMKMPHSLVAEEVFEKVQAIYADAPDKSGGKRRQNIRIKYDGIGFISLRDLVQKRKRHDQSHAVF
jgi:hypothetical protein